MRLLTLIFLIFLLSCNQERSSELFINGRIEGEQYDVSTKYPGRVKEVLVKEGQWVKKGEALAVLESEEEEALLKSLKARHRGALKEVEALEKETNSYREKLRALEEKLSELKRSVELERKSSLKELERAKALVERAEGALARARANYDKAEKDLKRFKALYERRVISKDRLEQVELRFKEALSGLKEAKALLKAYRAGVKEALLKVELSENRKREVESLKKEIRALRETVRAKEKGVEVAKERAKSIKAQVERVEATLHNYVIRSPVDGVVSYKLVEPGEVVGAGDRLFTLYNLKELYFEGFVPERDVGLLHLGQKALIKVDSYPNRSFKGALSFISTYAEFTPKEVQTKEERVKEVFKVKVRLLENPNFVLKPGMPADCFLEMGNGSR
jgi:HlyD family secretion protein